MPSLAKRNVTVVSMAVVVHLSARQWDLYTEFDGAEDAALRINRAIERAVAERPDREHVRQAAMKALGEEAYFGARDAEARLVLISVLDEIFGRE